MRVDWCVSSWFRIKNTHSHTRRAFGRAAVENASRGRRVGPRRASARKVSTLSHAVGWWTTQLTDPTRAQTQEREREDPRERELIKISVEPNPTQKKKARNPGALGRPSTPWLSDVVPSLCAMGECREQFDSVVAELERLSAHDDAESPAGPVCDACISP